MKSQRHLSRVRFSLCSRFELLAEKCDLVLNIDFFAAPDFDCLFGKQFPFIGEGLFAVRKPNFKLT
jgi:hypothetical protein